MKNPTMDYTTRVWDYLLYGMDVFSRIARVF